jgi:serine kinase of HPr protein (carbohydrate metabolism regulator)
MIAGLHSLGCISFGVPFRLSADSDELLTKMQRCVPFGTRVGGVESADARDFAVVGGRDAMKPVGTESVAEDSVLFDQLASALMVYVADHATDRVFVHAGVVGWKGHALVLPGTSFAGKTTLVAELVGAGASYYSDEYAVLDERGWVHPYARDLQVREAGGTEQRSVSVGQLDGSTGAAALPVSHVLFTEYVERGAWNPRRVSAGLAALEMMRHAIPVQRTPARVMATLAKVMETATALCTERGEASETARLVLAAMTGSSVRQLRSSLEPPEKDGQ